MNFKEIIQEIKDKSLPFNTKVYRLRIIDGNDGSQTNEYYLDKDERDSESLGLSVDYFFEKSTVTFRDSVFA